MKETKLMTMAATGPVEVEVAVEVVVVEEGSG